MEEKKQNDELQNRREFFKKAAKKALPIIGALLLANAPLIAKNVKTQMGCPNACRSSCAFRCEGCLNNCARSCQACSHGCSSGCHANCYTGCNGRVKNYA